MRNSDLLETVLRTKLEIAERVIDLLPENIKPVVKGVERTILTAVHDQLGRYLQKEGEEVKAAGVKKVTVE